jgi:hypothetical protein
VVAHHGEVRYACTEFILMEDTSQGTKTLPKKC